jgi:hypothetical protein
MEKHDTGCRFASSPKHAIYGKTELKNGIISKWLLFIDSALTRAEAEAEAIRIQSAWWKGVIVRCWCE